MSDFSALHPCPICGAPVQTYSGYRVRYPTTFDAGTWQRHQHALAAALPVPRECPHCEAAAVFEYDGLLYEAVGITLPMNRWRRHFCSPKPGMRSPTPPPRVAAVPPIKPVQDRLQRVPHDLQ